MEKFYKIFQKNFFYKKSASQPANGPLPVITISREMGSGGKSTANLIASYLGHPWTVYDHDLIDKIAKNKALEEKLANSLDPKRLPLADIIIAKTFGKRYPHLSGYHRHLIRTMTLIGLKGYTIILGRGANFLFPQALNIRMICHLEQRIIWQMTYENISRNEAIRRIDESDKERKKFIETLFNHNCSRAYHYDMVIRTGSDISVEDATNMIITMTKRKFKI
jgi:cytidylate kinase